MKRIFVFILAVELFSMVAMAQSFTLKSEDVKNTATGEQVANVFGCKGQNLSPQLHWAGAPAATKGFAITIFDKDAPRQGGFWHWVVYNIPATASSLKSGASNSLPPGAFNGLNDAGSFGYVGLCPPKGQRHEYIVTIYALKAKLPEMKDATPEKAASVIKNNSVGNASFSFFYQH